jgi:hypothetical protein
MEEEIERKRQEYREAQNAKRDNLQNAIYNNSNWIDKIKIRLRLFFERFR